MESVMNRLKMKSIGWKACVFSLTLCLSGCIPPASLMTSISPGMTKQQVIEVMGEPVSTTVTYTNEYLNYALAEGCRVSMPMIRCALTPYYVRFINGKVDTFGRTADFGASKQ